MFDMKPLRIFISSVQKEFAKDRLVLRDWLRNDALMRRFFEPFLFEDLPALDRRADEVYLDEVADCDIYIGMIGNDYGFEDAKGISPTEHEFNEATNQHKTRLIFIKGEDDKNRKPKVQAFIKKINHELIRRRFATDVELIAGVYAALVHHLEAKYLIRNGPFDAAPCLNATLADFDQTRMTNFIRQARHERGFPLAETATPLELLTHLNLINGDLISHAAMLLFGKKPQRFLITSEVKCAHFHGLDVAKPIPSLQVYKGTVFELVDQAVDFVMSKINLWVGTRAESTQVPIKYEIPREVVTEAIVNAVAHRDYTSNASIQVMLFADRLEVWNPGELPPSLTLEKLRKPHHSVPHNPLIAEPMYLIKYIERMGTGTRDMISRCIEDELPEPEFSVSTGIFTTTIWRKISVDTSKVTGQVPGKYRASTGQVAIEIERLVAVMHGEMSRAAIQSALDLRHRDYFNEAYLIPALNSGYVEMTIPNKPKSSRQKYRLTEKGLLLQSDLMKHGKP
jgi:predicted HTH transcriptional regulator